MLHVPVQAWPRRILRKSSNLGLDLSEPLRKSPMPSLDSVKREKKERYKPVRLSFEGVVGETTVV